MKSIRIIAMKEMTRVFSDRRLMFSLFVLPPIVIVLMYSMLGKLPDMFNARIKEHKAVISVKNAPESARLLAEQSGLFSENDIIYIGNSDETEEIERQIKEGTTDILVVFGENFLEEFGGYEKAGDTIPKIKIFYNTTKTYSTSVMSQYDEAVLKPLEKMLLQERLGNLESINVFQTEYIMTKKEEKSSMESLALILPYLIVLMLFNGSASLGIDVIAGEKERGTLALLLLAPLSRKVIAFGKMIALIILSVISSVIYVLAICIGLSFAAEAMPEGGNVVLSLEQIVQLPLALLCLVFLYVSVISFVSICSRTVREAQTYISIGCLIVGLAGVSTIFGTGIEVDKFMYLIPIYGHAVVIQNILTYNLTIGNFLLNMASSIVIILIFAFGVSKALENEKILFRV